MNQKKKKTLPYGHTADYRTQKSKSQDGSKVVNESFLGQKIKQAGLKHEKH